ncbi:MAG: D-tyrosyl-tRNA(Tyr) deacylase [Lentimicrobium sp.]|jgi:D-tyrosyl-tRNA(Tyr) deacylase|nr:D-tyrosyl-tRNA(Tyr) deacylase [Lentimicrobium sp.]MDD2527575.1 D-aminoacyl-tRNA deacylase [Lentimicrobiaceae bacterium]MDD4597113.1 D-aminoacyl-tRNA deacylase [Lentimicrobiaceae bacterium]MDY0025114.1 D-aminoacyl-tRNA deacylase [Lentimicrobium sp.]HAH59576.1 D-tyrosyl-tRNA(Tyr) deacylase [Bacteroidales bacterium]
MRVVIQRVNSAVVSSSGKVENKIGKGLLILLGIETNDDESDVEWLVSKIVRLRIFDDETGIMNLSVTDVGGAMMIVSQFTLHASTRKGNRPAYIKAARPEQAIPLYELLVKQIKEASKCEVTTGYFGAHMQVSLINDGPVTIIIDSKSRE